MHRAVGFFAVGLVLAFGAGWSTHAKKPASQRVSIPASVEQARLMRHIRYLASPALRGRRAFTKDSLTAARYIKRGFRRSGLLPGAQKKRFFQAIEGRAYHRRLGLKDQNVIGMRRGCGREVVLIGAHYDHLGIRGGQIYPGADDNASGVAVLMETARLLARRPATQRSLVWVGFGAEEAGLLGAKQFTRRPPLALRRIKLMINLDMVGRALLEKVFWGMMSTGLGMVMHKPDKRLMLWLNAASVRRQIQLMPLTQTMLSRFGPGYGYDSIPFNRKGISTLFFSTSLNADYHRPTDTVGKIRPKKVVAVARLMVDLLAKVAGKPCRAASRPASRPSTRPKRR